MNIRLGRMPWAIGWIFCVSIVAANTPAADEVALLVHQLGADDFGARENAAARLVMVGDVAIGPLASSICNDGLEAAWRATGVLQQIALNCDAAMYGRITDTLRHENERNGNKLAALISELNGKRVAHRRSIAHERIRAFGGRFGGDEPTTEIVGRQTEVPLPDPPPNLPLAGREPKQALASEPVLIADAYVSPLLSKDVAIAARGESLTIDQSWRGGDDGLVPLCDLPELSSLNLSRAPLTDAALDTIAQLPAIQSLEIEDMRFSAAALEKFRTRQPRARVVARGAKLLEVSAER